MSDEELLRQTYYSPKTMGSLSKLLKILKDKVPEKAIREFVKKQEYSQTHEKNPNVHVYMPIMGKVGEYQIDLMFYYAGAKLVPILCCICVSSRKAYAKAITSKKGDDVVQAFKEIYKETGKDITNLVMDKGSEFIDKKFMSYLSSEGIKHYFADVGSKTQTSIVESFNKTMRGLLNRYVQTISKNWRSALPDLLENYNSSPHSSLKGKAPQGITDEDIVNLDFHNYVRAQKYLRLLNSFKVGDKVRHVLKREMFSKGSPTFSKEIIEVKGFKGYRILCSDDKLYVARDLQKVAGEVESKELEKSEIAPEVRKKIVKIKRIRHELSAPKPSRELAALAEPKRRIIKRKNIRIVE